MIAILLLILLIIVYKIGFFYGKEQGLKIAFAKAMRKK